MRRYIVTVDLFDGTKNCDIATTICQSDSFDDCDLFAKEYHKLTGTPTVLTNYSGTVFRVYPRT